MEAGTHLLLACCDGFSHDVERTMDWVVVAGVPQSPVCCTRGFGGFKVINTIVSVEQNEDCGSDGDDDEHDNHCDGDDRSKD